MKHTLRKAFLQSRSGWILQVSLAAGLCIFLFAGARLEVEAARPTSITWQVVDGEEIYMSRCSSCHRAAGQGMAGVFPPLDGSEWVTGDKGRLIRIILGGVMGEMEVKGTTYSGAMPPWGPSMSDEQIAAVASYIRTSWSNDATEVTPEEVARVRAATQGHDGPWTTEELRKEANQGIPEAQE